MTFDEWWKGKDYWFKADDKTALPTVARDAWIAGQREALLEAAVWFDQLDIGDCWPEDELRRMAKELE